MTEKNEINSVIMTENVDWWMLLWWVFWYYHGTNDQNVPQREVLWLPQWSIATSSTSQLEGWVFDPQPLNESP